MSEQSFNLKIYTPRGLVLEARALSVTMPGSDGEIGILPEHTQYTGVLGAGIFQFQRVGSSATDRLIVSGGFASFQSSELTILADSVDLEETVPQLKATIAAEKKALEDKMANLNAFDPEWESVQQRLKRIDVIEHGF
jgi:F-type H+-transporting ATPase subunit epsilon